MLHSSSAWTSRQIALLPGRCTSTLGTPASTKLLWRRSKPSLRSLSAWTRWSVVVALVLWVATILTLVQQWVYWISRGSVSPSSSVIMTPRSRMVILILVH